MDIYDNYYDNELITYLEKSEIIVSINSKSSSTYELIEKNFRFKHGRGDFSNLKNKKYIKSNTECIAKDVIALITELVSNDICKKNETLSYVGDSLTKNQYEIKLENLLDIISHLVTEFPQHHYFLFSDEKKLLYISFEDEIFFGMA